MGVFISMIKRTIAENDPRREVLLPPIVRESYASTYYPPEDINMVNQS